MRPFYRCKNAKVTYEYGEPRLRAQMLQEHPGCEAGQWIITSPLASIDFFRGIAVTQNSIYQWRVE